MKRTEIKALALGIILGLCIMLSTGCEKTEKLCDILHPDETEQEYYGLALASQAIECGPTAEEVGYNNIEAQGPMPNLDTFGNKLIYHQFIYYDENGNPIFTNKCLSQNEVPDNTECFIVDDDEINYPAIVDNSWYSEIMEKNTIEGEDDLFTFILDQEWTAFHTNYIITNYAIHDYDIGNGLKLVKCGDFGEVGDIKRLVIDF